MVHLRVVQRNPYHLQEAYLNCIKRRSTICEFSVLKSLERQQMDLKDCLRSEKVALGVCIREQTDLPVTLHRQPPCPNPNHPYLGLKFEVSKCLMGYWNEVGLAFNCTFLLSGSVIQLLLLQGPHFELRESTEWWVAITALSSSSSLSTSNGRNKRGDMA
ncbi:hypothetical protein OIU85_029749 [Salix viminalis]|uniref:Uncharacterized protein n=1 Tax=Salix viminalis TaxID=40686 RepID=A0A9Q0QCH7_SALVM|nr:hypothetical protein OIU85_029749 [Salix viminalis]